MDFSKFLSKFGKKAASQADEVVDDFGNVVTKNVPIDINAAKKMNPAVLGGGLAATGAMGYGLMSEDEGVPSELPLELEEAPTKELASISGPSPEKKEESAISRLESLLKPRAPSMRTMDFTGGETENTVEGLKAAQGQRDEAALVNNLGRAAELIGSGISGAKPIAQQLFTDQAKAADKFVTDFKDRGEQEKNDPNSGISKAYQQILERFGVKSQGNVSAATLEKAIPWIERAYLAEENRGARKEQIAMQLAAREDAKKEKAEGKKHEHALKIAPKIQNKQYEKYSNLRSTGELVQRAMQNPNPQQDIALVYNFVKALDPESVVKEGEIQFSQAARGVSTRMKGVLEKALTGEILTPEERKNIFEFTKSSVGLGRKEWEASAKPYINQAKEMGIDLSEIVPDAIEDIDQKESKKEASKKSAKQGKTVVRKGYNAKTNQTQLIYSDGSKEIVDGRQ